MFSCNCDYIHLRFFQIYGPEGLFYKLSKECYTYKAAEYEYSICPFQRVRQTKFPSESRLLGSRPEWKQKSHGQYILHMVNGDASQCPNYVSRKAVVSNGDASQCPNYVSRKAVVSNGDASQCPNYVSRKAVVSSYDIFLHRVIGDVHDVFFKLFKVFKTFQACNKVS